MKKIKGYKLNCGCGYFREINSDMLEWYKEMNKVEFNPPIICPSCFTNSDYLIVRSVEDEEN